MGHFLACKPNIDEPGVAQLFVDEILCLHSLPKSVVTDRGTPFLNSFDAALVQMLGTSHANSTAYHPETDGQTERVNRMLGEMPRHHSNNRYDDWNLPLPLCEFAQNNAYNRASLQ